MHWVKTCSNSEIGGTRSKTKDAPSLIKAYWVAIFVQVDGSWKERLTCYNLAAPLGDKGVVALPDDRSQTTDGLNAENTENTGVTKQKQRRRRPYTKKHEVHES
jgi:hypothetical protein